AADVRNDADRELSECVAAADLRVGLLRRARPSTVESHLARRAAGEVPRRMTRGSGLHGCTETLDDSSLRLPQLCRRCLPRLLIIAPGDLIRATVSRIGLPTTLTRSQRQLIAPPRNLIAGPGDLIRATFMLIAAPRSLITGLGARAGLKACTTP